MIPPHSRAEDPAAEAFILAGGRSSRMGKDKSLIEIAGKPLIQHAVEILNAADLTPRIAGAQCDLSRFAPVIQDDVSQSGRGPLSGICSALTDVATPFAVFLPVDLPLMPASLITYLVHHAGVTQSAFAVVSVAGFIQTFPVVIDRAALPMLRSTLQSTDRNCLRAFGNAAGALSKSFSVVPVELLLQAGKVFHPQGIPPAFWFLNINSPRDLARAEDFVVRHLQVI